MKITEQSTKSITFVFNKDEEVSSFIQLLQKGSSCMGSGVMSNFDHDVVSSIERNLLQGKPSIPGTWSFKVSDNSGTITENSGIL